MRPFTVRVNSVIAENDVHFGNIEPPPIDCDVQDLPSRVIDRKLIEHLSAVEQQQLLDLIDEFAICFSDKPGLCDAAKHKIVTTKDFVPKTFKPYKIPEALKPEVEKQIDSLLQDGFVVPSTSPMISPIICVVKNDSCKTGSMRVRIVCDFRYLNKFTEPDAFPVPDQEEVTNKLASFQIISVFDAKAGYWQTEVDQNSQWLLGFATHHGLWQWTRTPFGAKNSGATFLRAIQHVLRPIRDICASYVDDMGVGSNTWEGHLINIRRFLNVIKDASITLNLQKCEFAKPFVRFVGYIVGSNLKYADPDKLVALQGISRPTTQKQIKSFLGMMAFHRMFIDHFADIAKPLTDLTSSKYCKNFVWSNVHEASFCELKLRLQNLVSLTVPRIGALEVCLSYVPMRVDMLFQVVYTRERTTTLRK